MSSTTSRFCVRFVLLFVRGIEAKKNICCGPESLDDDIAAVQNSLDGNVLFTKDFVTFSHQRGKRFLLFSCSSAGSERWLGRE